MRRETVPQDHVTNEPFGEDRQLGRLGFVQLRAGCSCQEDQFLPDTPGYDEGKYGYPHARSVLFFSKCREEGTAYVRNAG